MVTRQPITQAVFETGRERIHQMKRSAEYSDLAGEPTKRIYCRVEVDLLRAIKELQSQLQEVQVLKGHCHQYDDNDYCVICGADGRA